MLYFILISQSSFACRNRLVELSGAGRIEKLGGQNVGGSGDKLPRENFGNSYLLECYFLHLQEPFKTFIRSR